MAKIAQPPASTATRLIIVLSIPEQLTSLCARAIPGPSKRSKASNTGANDLFGASVAISGNTVVVGAYGEDSAASG